MEASENLSQEEIAEFARALDASADLSGHGAHTRDVRTYDFAHPDKLSKVHLRVLQSILSGLEKSWSGALSAMLRTEAAVTLSSIEQATFGAYQQSLPSPGVIAGIALGSLPGEALVDLPAALALGMVDRLTGGKGVLIGGPRSLTQVESRIIRRVIDRLAMDLSTAFRPVADLNGGVSDLYESADAVGLIEDEMLLVAGFVWAVASEEHKVNLAIPVNSLDVVRDMLTPERWLAGRAEQEQAPSPPNLLGVSVEVTAELGSAYVSIQDIVGIDVGDVIRLDRTVSDPLDVKVQGKVKFCGHAGLIGSRLAVQITDQVQEPEQTFARPETPGEQASSGG